MNVEDMLSAYRDATIDRLLEHIPEREPRRYLYDLLPAYPNRGGKGIRPALCIATCRALGGTLEAALPIAAALELLHNAFLVHDDIEDESRSRRGRPTLHEEHGVALALNAGDALVHLAYSSLLEDLPRTRLTTRILEEIDQMVRETVEGQALDLGWQRDRTQIAVEDYLRMTIKKTAWYTCISPVRLGALVGSYGRADLDVLFAYGAFLGAGFQIHDDLVDLESDDPIGEDVRTGKRTLPMLHLLAHAHERDRDEIVAIVGGRDALSSEDVVLVTKMMDAYGSIDFARSCIRGLAGAALAGFERGFADVPGSPDRDFLRGIVHHLLGGPSDQPATDASALTVKPAMPPPRTSQIAFGS